MSITKHKDITFHAKRKDNGEEITSKSLITIKSGRTGEERKFMTQQGEDIYAAFDFDGNCVQLEGMMYQIDPLSLTMDVVVEDEEVR